MQRRSANDVSGNNHEGLQRHQSACKSFQRAIRQTRHGTPYARPLLLGRTLIQQSIGRVEDMRVTISTFL